MQNTGMQGSSPAAQQPEATTEQASAGLSRLTDTAQQTMERFTRVASKAASQLSARGEELLKGAQVEKAKTYMREHPLATIGIAVAVGLVLSKLFSRR
jgi:ElaB/YqjD/DUF883 family membrane-anchored ribosome-binding protein